MASRKPRRPHNNQRQAHGHGHGYNNNQFTSDYESDYPNYSSDTAQQQEQEQEPDLPIPPPPRSNEDLNLAVLRRHNPSITSIVSLAPYAVIYVFSPTTRQWEKSGAEGTLFVCNLTQGSLGEERYNAFVLNRRGLNNFDIPLTDGENVELTEEYVILKSDAETGLEATNNANGGNNNTTGNTNNNNNSKLPTDVKIYGIWIYSEPPPNSTAQTRAINAQMIRECAVHAGQSLRIARERLEAFRQNGLHMAAEAATTTAAPMQEVQSSVPMGRQVSLKDLFGQQRAQDDGWTTRAHHLNLNMGDWQQPPPPLPPVEMGMGASPAAMHSQQSQSQPQSQPQPPPDVLGDLFRKAGLAYQGQ